MILSKKVTCRRSEKGSILVFALIILSLILISGLGMASTTLTQLRSTSVSGKSTAAAQNTAQGIESFLQQIYHEYDVLDTLDDIVGPSTSLPNLQCVDGKLIARSGLTSPFEITAFQKVGPDYLLSNLVEINDPNGCDVYLGDVAKFKIIGQVGQAARALNVEMTPGVNRGLIGKWGFEDNARALDSYGPLYGGSPAVSDGSRYNHALTLCPADEDPHGITIPFERCPQIIDAANISPPPALPIDQFYMDHDGTAFVPGIFDESTNYVDVAPPAFHSEAMYFNGTTNYLAINDSVDTTPNTAYYNNQVPPVGGLPAGNYTDPSKNKLSPEEAIAISLFVKKDSPSTEGGVLIANGTVDNVPGDNGYALRFTDAGKLIFRVQGMTGPDGQAEVDYPTDSAWHHVVVMWDHDPPAGRNLRIPEIYIDGALASTAGTARATKMQYNGLPFTVGGIYDGTDVDVFDSAAFRSSATERGFEGAIDELRIYERALTGNEIKELCSKAKEPLKSNCSL